MAWLMARDCQEALGCVQEGCLRGWDVYVLQVPAFLPGTRGLAGIPRGRRGGVRMGLSSGF